MLAGRKEQDVENHIDHAVSVGKEKRDQELGQPVSNVE